MSAEATSDLAFVNLGQYRMHRRTDDVPGFPGLKIISVKMRFDGMRNYEVSDWKPGDRIHAFFRIDGPEDVRVVGDIEKVWTHGNGIAVLFGTRGGDRLIVFGEAEHIDRTFMIFSYNAADGGGFSASRSPECFGKRFHFPESKPICALYKENGKYQVGVFIQRTGMVIKETGGAVVEPSRLGEHVLFGTYPVRVPAGLIGDKPDRFDPADDDVRPDYVVGVPVAT